MRVKPFAPMQAGGVEAELFQVILGGFEGLKEGGQVIFDGGYDTAAVTAAGLAVVVAQGILGESFAEALEHAVVVHDEALGLAGIDAVGAGDGLHEGVGLHGLVNVERLQALDIEAGKPHGADDGDAERMVGLFEGIFDVQALAVRGLEAVLHDNPVGDDVEVPLFEVADLVLGLADDDLNDRGLQPLGLAAEPFHFAGQGLPAAFLDGAAERIFLQKGIAPDLGQFRFPERDDALVHAGAGDFVNADQHGFAALPARGAVLDEVGGELVQAVAGGDDFVVLAEQLLQQGFLVRVELGPGDGFGDTVVEIEPGDAEFFAAILVHQLDGGIVFLGAFEVVARDVAAEDAPGQVVILEKRRAGEADE